MERQALKREVARNQQREQLLARGEPGPLVVRHVGAENAHDLAATLATLHPDCVYEDVPTGRVFQGHEGARRFYEEWWTGLNLTVTPRSEGKLYWSDDGVHIAESCFRGRHLGPFLGLRQPDENLNSDSPSLLRSGMGSLQARSSTTILRGSSAT